MVDNTITFIHDKVLDVLNVQGLLPHQSQDTTGAADNNVRTVVPQLILILLDAHATEEDSCSYCWHVLLEPIVLFADLEGQLTSVAQGENADLIKRQQQKKKGFCYYYRKCVSASYCAWGERERYRERERERERDGSGVTIVALKLVMSLHFP